MTLMPLFYYYLKKKKKKKPPAFPLFQATFRSFNSTAPPGLDTWASDECWAPLQRSFSYSTRYDKKKGTETNRSKKTGLVVCSKRILHSQPLDFVGIHKSDRHVSKSGGWDRE